MNGLIWLRVAFYVGSLALYYLVFLTAVGNYFHGGTVAEAVLLQGLAVALLAVAVPLARRTRIGERVVVLLLAALPAIGLALSVASMFYK